jgi:hypothetical protein
MTFGEAVSGPLDALRAGDWFVVNLWIVAGVFAFAALYVLIDWLVKAWITNVLRNSVEGEATTPQGHRQQSMN